ncbi:MAG: bifunctional adenosylcobinamide kinase/adenosylcobinamide-phosphate guanylyltransferase [Lachnospiraceae bacterium]|nr:bifunctional adenosylcobinamide kinase/adenosylcobinamide-phosphate guanylyltransferase [Lachnospiraceae bacterium]
MLTMVIGGSGSGKSAYAEDLVLSLGEKKRLYIATMEVYDDESRARVVKHRRQREGKGFETLEIPTHLERAMVPAGSTVLLECMSNLVANEIFSPSGQAADCVERIIAAVTAMSQSADVVVVTNDVFADGVIYDEYTTDYLKKMALVNAGLSDIADRVVEVVAGIPVIAKAPEESLAV